MGDDGVVRVKGAPLDELGEQGEVVDLHANYFTMQSERGCAVRSARCWCARCAGARDRVGHVRAADPGVFELLEVEAVVVHDFGPGGHKVLHELVLGVAAGVDLGDRAQL